MAKDNTEEFAISSSSDVLQPKLSAHLCFCHLTCSFHPIALLDLPLLCIPSVLGTIERNCYHNAKRIPRVITSIVQILGGNTVLKQQSAQSRLSTVTTWSFVEILGVNAIGNHPSHIKTKFLKIFHIGRNVMSNQNGVARPTRAR